MAQGQGILALGGAVLEQICSNFCPHCRGEDCMGGLELPGSFWGPEYLGTLDALTKVNSALAGVAQQVRPHVFCGRRNSLALLARTLVERPALAEHLRVVRLGDCDLHREGCILRSLASLQDAKRLATLVLPGLDADNSVPSEAQEQLLLAPFHELPPIEEGLVVGSSSASSVSALGINRGPCMAGGSAPAMVANSRLNAFVVFKLAKKIESVAVLSEWPLALFPLPSPAPKIIVKQAKSTPAPDRVAPGSLPEVKELRLNMSNENRHPDLAECPVDIRKCAGLLTQLPNLRTLELCGGIQELTAATLNMCRPTLANLTTLNVTSTSVRTLSDIIRGCSFTHLRHFRYTIPGGTTGDLCEGRDMQGHRIVALLEEHGLHHALQTLQLDTSESLVFAGDPRDIRAEGFQTVPTLAHFASLRHVSISADNIYYPSLYPRVLLREPNLAANGAGEHQRLENFFPPGIESLEITGIYAIHVQHLARLADCCNATLDGICRFKQLRRVDLRGSKSIMVRSAKETPYPVPEDDADPQGGQFETWADTAEYAEMGGGAYGAWHGMVVQHFANAGVAFDFDMPEFYFDQFAGNWDDDLEAYERDEPLQAMEF